MGIKGMKQTVMKASDIVKASKLLELHCLVNPVTGKYTYEPNWDDTSVAAAIGDKFNEGHIQRLRLQLGMVIDRSGTPMPDPRVQRLVTNFNELLHLLKSEVSTTSATQLEALTIEDL